MVFLLVLAQFAPSHAQSLTTTSAPSPLAAMPGGGDIQPFGAVAARATFTASGQMLLITTRIQAPQGNGDRGPVPTGTVAIALGGKTLGTASLVAGAATLDYAAAALAPGSYTIEAQYSGDAVYSALALASSFSVPAPATAVVLNSSSNPAAPGQPVTFTATGAAGTLDGSVNFLDGNTSLGTMPMSGSSSSSAAALTTSSLGVGTHTIVALFLAARSALATESNVVNQVIQGSGPPDFTLTVTPNPASIGVGLIAALQVTVTPVNGFSDSVALSCPVSLPTETTCTFSVPAIAAGSGPAILYIATTSPHDCGSTVPYFFGTTTKASTGGYPKPPGFPERSGTGPEDRRSCRSSEGSRPEPPATPANPPGPYWTAALAGLVIVLIPRRRVLKSLLSALLCIFLGGTLLNTAGCGHCTDLGTKPATYTLPVSGQSSGVTSIAHTAEVKLTVQP